MEFHEAANLFPMLTGAEFDELCGDIAKGFDPQFPIITIDGKILDGRNRYAACLKMGVDPVYQEYHGKDTPIVFVTRANLHRRHLTASQRAAFAVEAMPMLEAEARERQAHGMTAPGKTLSQTFDEASNGRASEQAADLFGTNRQYVSDAKRIAEVAPDLLEQVKAGEMTIPQAKREVNYRNKTEAPRLDGKYQVIYADPPWSYNNSGFDQSAAQHYPTMSTDDICNLDVRGITDNPCVLFLWATVPLLPDALRVMEAWGFEYKTNRVWVKDKGPSIGWWLNTRHELLLIGARGSGIHPDEKLDSVITASVSVHSRKPDTIYQDIERQYSGSKIELFGRAKRDGWTIWGNENV